MASKRTFPALLLSVRDGDTIHCDIDLGFNVKLSNVSCRLLGLNTPELPTPEGIAATEHLKQLLSAVEPMTLIVEGKAWYDKYDRCLITIMKGETNINQRMIADGHASVMMKMEMTDD